jgi:hypothetical protein
MLRARDEKEREASYLNPIPADNNEAMKTSVYLNENLGTKFITLGPGTLFLFFLTSLFRVTIKPIERCRDQVLCKLTRVAHFMYKA